VKIDNGINWRKKHFFSIRQNYSRAPFYRDYINLFEEAYSKEWEYLIDLDMHFILRLSESLGMKNKKILRASALKAEGDRIERLIKICGIFEADTFYEGEAGRNYIDEKVFADHGIRVEYQNYRHPVYNQLYGDFIPYLSVIDLLFNHGRDSLAILTNTAPEGVIR